MTANLMLPPLTPVVIPAGYTVIEPDWIAVSERRNLWIIAYNSDTASRMWVITNDDGRVISSFTGTFKQLPTRVKKQFKLRPNPAYKPE